jgi:hypothetical protein
LWLRATCEARGARPTEGRPIDAGCFAVELCLPVELCLLVALCLAVALRLIVALRLAVIDAERCVVVDFKVPGGR